MTTASTVNIVEQLKSAVELARQGNKAEARAALAAICAEDPGNEKAWLWQASLAETTEQAIGYLERVLAINPSNATAATWMEKFRPPEEEAAPAETKVNCPFCLYQADADFPKCPDCGAVPYLDLLEIEAHDGANDRHLQQSIKHYLAGLASRTARTTQDGSDTWNDFVAHYYLATAYLNLRQSANAMRHLQIAHDLEPNDKAVERTIRLLGLRKIILAVDDCATVRALVSGTLERKRFRVITAENGVEAMRSLAETVPHLILIDVSMPMMDGYQACKKIKSDPRTKSIPVVMLSGNDGFVDKVRGKIAGASDYLSKPFNATAVIEVIRRHIKA